MDTLKLKEVQEELQKYVIGQDQGCNEATASVFKYLLNLISRDYGNQNLTPHTLLITGSTGTGKTYIIKTLAKLLDIYLIEINAKSISQEGWHGTSFKKLLTEALFEQPANTKGGIIFIDEFDKMLTPNISSGNDDVNFHLQSSLLKYIEGFDVQVNHYNWVNTSAYMFVFAGAFSSLKLEDNVNIGFLEGKSQKDKSKRQKYLDAFIEYGMLPEVAGRIKDFISLNKLTHQDYKDILLGENFNGQLWQEMLARLDIESYITDTKADKMVEAALDLNLGVRGLYQILEDYITTLMLEHKEKVDLNKFSPLYVPPLNNDEVK